MAETKNAGGEVYQLPMMAEFTPSEKKIMNVLKDGMAHTLRSIRSRCFDEYTDDLAIQQHFSTMRKKLQPKGYDILCRNGVCRCVQMINPHEE